MFLICASDIKANIIVQYSEPLPVFSYTTVSLVYINLNLFKKKKLKSKIYCAMYRYASQIIQLTISFDFKTS